VFLEMKTEVYCLPDGEVSLYTSKRERNKKFSSRGPRLCLRKRGSASQISQAPRPFVQNWRSTSNPESMLRRDHGSTRRGT